MEAFQAHVTVYVIVLFCLNMKLTLLMYYAYWILIPFLHIIHNAWIKLVFMYKITFLYFWYILSN